MGGGLSKRVRQGEARAASKELFRLAKERPAKEALVAEHLVTDGRSQLVEIGEALSPSQNGGNIPEAAAFLKRVRQLFRWRSKLEAYALDISSRLTHIESTDGGLAQDSTLFAFCRPDKDSILNVLYKVCNIAKAQLDALGTRIATEIEEVVYEPTDLKPRERALEKYDNPRQLLDVARGSLICSDCNAFVDVIDALRRAARVVRLKNRFRSPHFNGYRDCLVSVEVQCQRRPIIVELQVHHKQLKTCTERNAYRPPMANCAHEFYRAVFSETLETHTYFDGYFQCGGSFETLRALADGNRSILPALFERGTKDRTVLKQLDFLLDKLGDIDFRSKALFALSAEEPAASVHLASILAENGLSKDQAERILFTDGKTSVPHHRLIRRAIRPEKGDKHLFGLLTVNLLGRALVASSPPKSSQISSSSSCTSHENTLLAQPTKPHLQ